MSHGEVLLQYRQRGPNRVNQKDVFLLGKQDHCTVCWGRKAWVVLSHCQPYKLQHQPIKDDGFIGVIAAQLLWL